MTEFSDTPEDQLVNAIIEHWETGVEDAKGVDGLTLSDVEIYPEAHYNHYGTRGVADLYVKRLEDLDDRVVETGFVYEVKSEHAVEEAKGANEIIEQYNRMKNYFFKDDAREHPGDVRFELCFIPTPVTWQHVVENQNMYSQLIEGNSIGGERVNSRVCFRVPEVTPIALNPFNMSSPREALEEVRTDWKPYVGLD